MSYCLKCKRKTGNVGEHIKVARNGARMAHSKCSVCGTKKCGIVPKNVRTGNGVRRGRGGVGKSIGSFLGGLAGGFLPF